MEKYSIRYDCPEDGCTYFWDDGQRKWMKICPVDKLPFTVRKRVLEDGLGAETLLNVEV